MHKLEINEGINYFQESGMHLNCNHIQLTALSFLSTPFTYVLLDQFRNSCKLTAIQVSLGGQH